MKMKQVQDFRNSVNPNAKVTIVGYDGKLYLDAESNICNWAIEIPEYDTDNLHIHPTGYTPNTKETVNE